MPRPAALSDSLPMAAAPSGLGGGPVLRWALRCFAKAGGIAALSRFLAIGCVGLGVDAALFNLGTAAGLPEAASRALSLAAATLVTWQLNRRLTFGASTRHLAEESARYAVVALAAQGFSYGLFLLFRASLPMLPANAALVGAAALAAGFSFTGQRFFTFGTLRQAAAGDLSTWDRA